MLSLTQLDIIIIDLHNCAVSHVNNVAHRPLVFHGHGKIVEMDT